MDEERVVIKKESLASLAGAVRIATGGTAKLKASDLVGEIGKIVSVRDLVERKITSYTNYSLTMVYAYTFYQCANLKYVNLPKATVIEDRAFSYSGVTDEVVNTLLKKCIQLGNGAFAGCGSLTSIKTPITSSYCFQGCTNLTKLDFSETKQYSFSFYAVEGCNKLKTLLCGSKQIDNYSRIAIDGGKVWLSSNCTSADANTFSKCKNLKVYVEATTAPAGYKAGWDVTADGTATVAYGVSKEEFEALAG